MSNIVKQSSNSLANLSDMREVADVISKSGLFRANGWNTPEQIMTLMLLCQAEGKDPISGMNRYDLIQGRVGKRSMAMLSDFLASGGKVEWHHTDDQKAEATFTSPDEKNSIKMDYTIVQARKAKLVKPGGGYDKHPEDMLRWRLVSKALRIVFPQCTNLMQSTEELYDDNDNASQTKTKTIFAKDEGQDLTPETAKQVVFEKEPDVIDNPKKKFLALVDGHEKQACQFLQQIGWLPEDTTLIGITDDIALRVLEKPDGFMEKVKAMEA